jgi:hypothetical protein
MSVGSTYSAASVDVPGRFETGVGMQSGTMEAGLVVRPDALLMTANIEKRDASAAQALAQAQLAATELVARLQQVAGAGAIFTPCATMVKPLAYNAKAAAQAEKFSVGLSGRIEIGLAPELDYWKRSALIVALAELAKRYEDASIANTPDKGVSLVGMKVIVKNPDAHRAKLTEQWVQRAHAFAAAAQTREAPLHLLDCAPPGEIVQKEKSLEEVWLSLAVSCRPGSLKAAAALPVPAAR